MADVAFVKSLGDIRLEDAQPLTAFRDLAAEAHYASGATNHDRLMHFDRDLPAEALYASGSTNHDTLMHFERDLPAEAIHNSGATAHDTSGFAINSPYVCPEEGCGVITDYSV
ncbi:MAG: hypothetical protein IKN64_03010 [Desulfovibrio sp.]|nr:hypothetical protein [Desulfovibrio sp.]